GSVSSLKLGKLKVVRRQLLQRYEHQPFVSCLAGLYGCQWRRYQRAKSQPGESCCSRVECGSVVFLVLTFLLSSLFLYFWSQAHNDYNDFDWFKFETLGFWFPWSLVLLVVAAALFTYISLLLVRTSTTTINTAILILLILLYYYYYYTTTAAHLTYISLLLVRTSNNTILILLLLL
uniref:Glycerophosphodiester phosphodiesterase domain containing 4a n=1 Tax=Oncorhynchus mykiss TaxID=8022 RepID=A0A8K9UJN7_ONCMY